MFTQTLHIYIVSIHKFLHPPTQLAKRWVYLWYILYTIIDIFVREHCYSAMVGHAKTVLAVGH